MLTENFSQWMGSAVPMSKSVPSRLEAQIARQILDLVWAEDLQPGHRFREQALANRFGVSRTPVRVALHLLARSGALTFAQHRGFTLAKPPEDLAASEASLTPSANEALYINVATDRLSGSIGDDFTETELVRRYGVSRTPLLAVLARMAQDGLIERGKGREWRFRPFLDSREAHAQSYDFRLLVEPASILLPTFKANASKLRRAHDRHERLLKSNRHYHSFELFDVDASFHELLAELSGNPFCLSMVRSQNQLRRLVEYGGYGNKRRVKAWIHEHLAIIEALLQKNQGMAADLLGAHLRKARQQPVRIPSKTRPQLERLSV